jgi:hypothetical protein
MKSISTIAAAALAFAGVSAGQCSPQGAGNCNLVYGCSSEIASDNVDCEMALYNYLCEQIGGFWSPNPGQALYSQLPYSIVIESLMSVYTPAISMTFRYGAGTYGNGISNCHTSSCSNGLVACEDVTCSFPC